PEDRVHQALQPVPAHEADHPAQHPRLPARAEARSAGAGRHRRTCANRAGADAGGGPPRPGVSAARTAPLVVVGGGVAGLSVALAVAPRPVLLLSRGRNGNTSATALAQGGIAAAIGPCDTPAAHARDTVEAGAGHNDRAAVRYLCAQAPAAIARLLLLGLAFDHDGSVLRLGREGGHGVDRIVHAGGDA